MAKKKCHFLITICLICIFSCLSAHDAYARRRPANNAVNPRYAMIIMDAQSGRVLEEENADRALPPASLTKIMTLFMVFEALEHHQITMDTPLTITKNALNQAPSKIGLQLGDKMTIQQAILVLVTRSANDVAMALAETIGGNEKHFTDMMTQRARSLGMRNSVFYNPSGLPNPGQKSSARDMALLARAHMQYFPQYYHFFNTIRTTYKGQNVETHNNLMRRFPGMDGLKTGYTYASGFNLVSSAVRNNRRIIVAVFGGKSAVARDNHVADLMNRGLAVLTGEKVMTQVASIAAKEAVMPDVPSKKTEIVEPTPAPAKIAPAAGAIKSTADRNGWRPDGGGIKPLQIASIATTQPAVQVAAIVNNANKNWGVQVGAFSSSSLSQQTLNTIQTQLRSSLTDVGQAVIVPAQTAQGTVYRARIIGLSAQDATKACQIVADCMAFAAR